MKFASLPLVTWRNLLMRPRTVSDGTFEQSTIFEFVIENRFEEVQIRDRFGILQSAVDYNKRRKLVEKRDLLPALEMVTDNFRYRLLRGRSGLVPAGLAGALVAGVAGFVVVLAGVAVLVAG